MISYIMMLPMNKYDSHLPEDRCIAVIADVIGQLALHVVIHIVLNQHLHIAMTYIVI